MFCLIQRILLVVYTWQVGTWIQESDYAGRMQAVDCQGNVAFSGTLVVLLPLALRDGAGAVVNCRELLVDVPEQRLQ